LRKTRVAGEDLFAERVFGILILTLQLVVLKTWQSLWDGHDPVRLAAREASIRARMVARARARASEENVSELALSVD
jgi:hypothetical protein